MYIYIYELVWAWYSPTHSQFDLPRCEFANVFLFDATIYGVQRGESSRWELTRQAAPPPALIFRKAQSCCHHCSLLGQSEFARAESSLHSDRGSENEQPEWRTPGNPKLQSCCTSLAISLEPLTEVSVCLSCSLACCFAPSHMSTQTRSKEHRQKKVWEEGKVREEQLLEKRVKVIVMHRLLTYLLKVFPFRQFLIQVLTNSLQVCFKFAQGFRKWVLRNTRCPKLNTGDKHTLVLERSGLQTMSTGWNSQ